MNFWIFATLVALCTAAANSAMPPTKTASQAVPGTHSPIKIEKYDSCPHGVCHSFLSYFFGKRSIRSIKPEVPVILNVGEDEPAIDASQYAKRDDDEIEIPIDTDAEHDEEKEEKLPLPAAFRASSLRGHQRRPTRVEAMKAYWQRQYAKYDETHATSE